MQDRLGQGSLAVQERLAVQVSLVVQDSAVWRCRKEETRRSRENEIISRVT